MKHVKNIGVVFGQRSQLCWDVPVIDSYELLRDIYNVSQSQYKSTLDMLVETLDISDIINTPVRQLSLGQRMRCEIAASLIHSPKILFLDEPTIGLDAVSKIAVRNFIKTINKEKGVTVILTTHDMNDIEALASRILLIGKGQILYDGNINDLRSRFSENKIVTVEYHDNHFPIDIPGINVISQLPGRTTFSADTKIVSVPKVINHLSDKLNIIDFTIDSQPIEEIIVELYKEYKI